MSSRKLAKWLDRKIDSQRKLCWLGAAVSLLIGAVVLYVTFWVAYGVIWFASTPFGDLSSTVLTASAATFIVLLFIGNATTDREYLNQLEVSLDPTRGLKVFVARMTGNHFMLGFLDPETARSFIKVLTTLLYTGPRAIGQSWRLVDRARQLAGIPRETAAGVMALLLKKEARVPFADLLQTFDERDLLQLLPRMTLIDGVIVLTTPPPGLTLAPSLADEFHAA